MDKFIITVSNLYKTYKNEAEKLTVLQGVNLTVNEKSTISIMGESGSGKSTLLNCIGGLESISSGQIFIGNTDISMLDEKELNRIRNTEIGFVFQSHYLLEEFTAIENVMIPFLINDFNKKTAAKIASDLLECVGLSDRINFFPSRLSGGEKQRVAIARSFINNPKIILADEPTGNLDEKNAMQVMDLLLNINKTFNHSLIVITHSKTIAEMTDFKYHLSDGILKTAP